MTHPRHSQPPSSDTLPIHAAGTGAFEIVPSLADGSDAGSLRLGAFERQYESLFAEALEGGEISPQERERLNLAAAALGLDATRVASLESALLALWESEIAETLDDPEGAGSAASEPSLADAGSPQPPISDQPTVRKMPASLKASRSVRAPPPVDALHLLFAEKRRSGCVDDPWRIAEVLARQGSAKREELALREAHRERGPIRPIHPLSNEAWVELLMHEEQDRNVSDVFGVIASAALVSRVSAMRRDGSLPRLPAESLQEPATSSVTAVRAVAWASATLGIRTPPIYVAPSLDEGFALVTVIPPSTRIGARMLSGVDTAHLAFASGRHLAFYREEHFICTLVPTVAHLEAIFYAALLLVEPKLVVPAQMQERARVFSQAIVPCLEPPNVERLRRLAAHLLQANEPVNLQQWARAVEWTACRAGLLLCGSLETAASALAKEPDGESRFAELEAFWVSEAAGELRKRLGVSLD